MHTLLANLATTWALVGLIWTIQVVHYPLFAAVGDAAFGAYHRAHNVRITMLVGPLMVAELGLALWLLFDPSPASQKIPMSARASAAGLVVIVWLLTAFAAVPVHDRLAQGLDAGLVHRLVMANAWRTAAWTLRGGLMLWCVQRAL